MLCCLLSALGLVTSPWVLLTLAGSALGLATSPWVLLTLAGAALMYLYLTWNFKHWERMGVPFLTPVPFFGNIKKSLMFRVSFHEMQEILYRQLEGHAIGGFFEGRRPVLMLRDPDLIRNIMVRDFECFVDRQVTILRPKAYEENNLLSLKGKEWKEVRSISTPIFTSGKMKQMSHLITHCTEQMIKYLDKYHTGTEDSQEIEMKEFFGRFTLDVIASCAFGVQCNSLENPDAEFVRITSKFNKRSTADRLALFLSLVIVRSAALARLLGVRFMKKEAVDFLAQVLLQGKAQRQQEALSHGGSTRRVDFLQLMLDAQAGRLKDTKDDVASELFEREAQLKSAAGAKPPASSALTDEVVIGQSLLFLLAGFETSSTLLTFAAYELALHPELQQRARAEVRTALELHPGNPYQAIAHMPFLENVLHEALRKHPPVSRVDRVCTTSNYELAGTSARLVKGDVVCIPVRGLHYDPRYYPEPHKFDPDRFLPENRQQRSPYVYLPFGSGPRNCIGMRFAMMSTKMAMASLLNVYSFEPCERTQVPYKINIGSMMLRAADGIYLTVKKI